MNNFNYCIYFLILSYLHICIFRITKPLSINLFFLIFIYLILSIQIFILALLFLLNRFYVNLCYFQILAKYKIQFIFIRYLHFFNFLKAKLQIRQHLCQFIFKISFSLLFTPILYLTLKFLKDFFVFVLKVLLILYFFSLYQILFGLSQNSLYSFNLLFFCQYLLNKNYLNIQIL